MEKNKKTKKQKKISGPADLDGIVFKKMLAPLTAYRIGGPADYYFKAKNAKDLIMAATAAKKNGLPLLILGGGSNVLIGDEGFRGLVVRIILQEAEMKDGGRIIAGSGLRLSALADLFLENSFTGMEWAAGIPGTVGGAVRGNAGAFLSSMADVTESVDVLDVNDSEAGIKTFSNKDCRFAYRESIFKKNKNLVIVSCEVFGKKGESNTIRAVSEEYLSKKKKSQPLSFPSAGSVFKNPKDMFAAKLIEECGLKGKKIGGAMISPIHANFIVNTGSATADDVKQLIALAKIGVFKKFNLELEEEIEIIG